MTRRTLAVALVGTLLGAPSAAQPVGQPPATDADTAVPFDVTLRSVQFGVRLTDVDGEEGRFQRYRDYRSGPLLEAFRFTRDDDARRLRVTADNVGYRDQGYAVSLELFGRVKAWARHTRSPYFQHARTRSLFTEQNATVVRAPDDLRAGIENGSTTLVGSADAFARPFELRVRRDITDLGVQYRATRNTDLNLSLVSTRRDGHQAWAGNFGFGAVLELPAPVRQRTTELAANLEWSNSRGRFRAGYDGSLFNSDADSLTFDSVSRVTSTASASALGRMSGWPSSSVHTLSATGSMALPGKSRATAYLARSAWAQDTDLLPHTINPAITSPPLERSSVQGDAAVTALMLRVTSRPRRWAWLNASYRGYDFDNRTPPLTIAQRVNYDQSVVVPTSPTSHPLSFQRGLLELDTSVTPWRNGAFRVGFTREAVDRSFRLFEQTVEHGLRVGYDWTSNPFVTVRAHYLHANRTGTGLDEEVNSDIGEQVSLRQFDISERIRDTAQVIVTAIPIGSLSFNLNVAVGQDERPDANFGVRSQEFTSVGGGVDFAPGTAVTTGLMYTVDTFGSLQASRQANPGPQFDDPTRDWFTDADERVHTLNAYLELPRLTERTDLRLQYDYMRARSTYRYDLAPNSTLTTPTALSPLSNSWQQARLESTYWLRRNLGLGLTYLHDRFDVQDFALGPATLDRLAFSSSLLLMQYTWAPYTANAVWLKATYLW